MYLRLVQNKRKAEGKLSLVPINKEDYRYWNPKTQRFDSQQKRFISYNLMLNALENEFHNFKAVLSGLQYFRPLGKFKTLAARIKNFCELMAQFACGDVWNLA